ncbi:MAG: FeS-binding protein [Deltaproteobacteria bacterium]|nr:MAG: FeS-binding protein [Deltaproteobacteria bacterium]
MGLAEDIRHVVEEFVATSASNVSEEGGKYFVEPLVGFADIRDPIFKDLKDIIGGFHWTPAEALKRAGFDNVTKGSVISCVFPINPDTILSNRNEGRFPSRRWAHTRNFGEMFITALKERLVEFLAGEGFLAVAPPSLDGWKMLRDERVGYASPWSERHVAYAAGLGTFSLNDGLITERGMSHRLGSVVTNAELPYNQRAFDNYRANCLTFADEKCGACIKRCPTGALSPDGHDKDLCKNYCYGDLMGEKAKEYGVKVTGCGLCQTRVPCERQNPVAGKK